MARTLGTMFTITTYGTWLRGARGWIDEGKLMPPDPELQAADKERLKYPVYYFPRNLWYEIGGYLGEGLIKELDLRIYALTVRTWHLHFVVGNTRVHYSEIVKCAKDKIRYGLEVDRPSWGDGCDKRFCFDQRSLLNRIRYVDRHNLEDGHPARPWPFLQWPACLRGFEYHL